MSTHGEGPPEVPVIEIQEHSPAAIKAEVEHEAQPRGDAAGTPLGLGAGAGLPRLSLPAPASAGAPDRPRRYSLDGAASVHSDSGWEMLSHRDGQHSHCGSSPRSVSPSDAYDSEGEGEARGARAPPPAGAQGAGEGAGGEPEPAPFGSLVLEGHMEAAAELRGAPRAASSAPPSLGSPAPSLEGPSSAASSPRSRSSYERPSSHGSRHDLYSLSQDDHLSDHDSFADDMMLAGEPDAPAAGLPCEHGGHPAGTDAPAKPVRLALAPAATAAAAARGAYCAASAQLHALAASVSAYLARVVPAGMEVAQRALAGVAGLAASLSALPAQVVCALQERIAPLAPLAADAAVRAAATAAAVRARCGAAAAAARKGLGTHRVPWARVSLALGLTTVALGALLCRSMSEQARTAALLAKREYELGRLLTKVAELQRAIQAHRSVPLIRHVNCSLGARARAAAAAPPNWPAVILV